MGEIASPRPARRLDELSLCNLLFCGMVLLLHLCSDAIVSAPRDSVFYIVVFSFWKLCAVAVYGFLFLSGCKAFLGRRRPLRAYYLRRARVVLLPYLLWSPVYYLVRIALGHESFSLAALFSGLLLGSHGAHLYYIIALLQFYLLMPLWRRMVDRLPAVIILPLLGVLSVLLPDLMHFLWQRWLPGLPVYLDRFFMSYLFVWCAGCYAGANYVRFQELLHQSRRVLWVAAAALLPLYLYCGYQNHVRSEWFGFLTSLQQYYHILAIGAVLALARPLAKCMRLRILQALDRASYQIYLSHMLPLIAAPWILRRLGVTAAAPQLLLRAVIVLVPTLGGCLLWQWLWERRRSHLNRL